MYIDSIYRNSEVIGTCIIGYICDSNKYNKFVAKHKKIKKLYVHILHYEWVTHTHTYTHFFTHTCMIRTLANTLTHTRFIQMYHPTPCCESNMCDVKILRLMFVYGSVF